MLKILIAEDDRELRQLFSHVLNRHGYTVTGVSNGQEALDAMDADFYDMIISDMATNRMVFGCGCSVCFNGFFDW